MDVAWGALGPLAKQASLSFTYVAAGVALKRSNLLAAGDGEVILRAAYSTALPALVFASCTAAWSTGPSVAALILGASAAHTGAVLAAGWAAFGKRPPRERALLVGSLCGAGVGAFSVPMIAAVLGGSEACVRLFDVVSTTAACALGAVALESGGDGGRFKGLHKHADGGVYDGEWGGGPPPKGRKEGSGVYVYPSGARYDGEWRDNMRDGRGVYLFPKGGMYEGVIEGLGMRTFSDGRVKMGRWAEGKLKTALPGWQCQNAARGAREAAAAAHRVARSGRTLADVAMEAALAPPALALYAGAAVALAGAPVPQAIAEGVVAPLVNAARPAMLIALGALLPAPGAEAAAAGGKGVVKSTWGLTRLEMRDAAQVVAVRVVASMAAGAAILAALGGRLPPPVAAAIALAAAAPAPEVVMLHSLRSRNGGSLPPVAVLGSQVVSAVVMAGVYLAYVKGGAPVLAGACAAAAAAAAAAAGAVRAAIGPREVRMSMKPAAATASAVPPAGAREGRRRRATGAPAWAAPAGWGGARPRLGACAAGGLVRSAAELRVLRGGALRAAAATMPVARVGREGGGGGGGGQGWARPWQ